MLGVQIIINIRVINKYVHLYFQLENTFLYAKKYEDINSSTGNIEVNRSTICIDIFYIWYRRIYGPIFQCV